MHRKAILVVEDNLAIAEVITLALNDDPTYHATSVSTGAAALAQMAAAGADLILLDINLPGLSGFALHDILRRDPAHIALPILFMTAGDHAREFFRRGVRTWLAKPFDLEDLVARVDRLLRPA